MDGELGAFLVRKTEERIGYRILGWFENGFRHISNRLRPVHLPADLKGMKIRVLPSEIQKRTFELLGAVAMRMDLTEAIAMIKAGTLDAQENPLANTVTYGVHKFHKFHTLTYHFYISRPIFLHRAAFDAWPDDLRRAMQAAVTEAVAFQRKLAVEEHDAARKIIEEAGCEIVELTRKNMPPSSPPCAAHRRRAQDVWRRDVQDGAEGLGARRIGTAMRSVRLPCSTGLTARKHNALIAIVGFTPPKPLSC